jgi:hypothetical protein
MTAEAILNPLVRRGLFSDVEHAARSLVHSYVLQQIDLCRKEIAEHENRHGLSFEQFTRYTEKRTEQLRQTSDWSETQRIALAQAVMQDEQDWLEWKATEDLLRSWLGLQSEA